MLVHSYCSTTVTKVYLTVYYFGDDRSVDAVIESQLNLRKQER